MSENNEKCQCQCGCGGKDEREEKLVQIIKDCNYDKSQLMHILNETQNIFGYIPMRAQKIISEELGIPMAEIYGVITFYSRFSLEPKGKYNIAVCLGTACYVKGSQGILDKLKEILGIDVGGITPDGKFSLEATRCIGACGLAPVMTINEEVYGKLDPSMIKDILEKYQ
ncbi:MAG: NAD(P)H-dependent oxidoreductase subunit E [Clostridia bacterium]|nr:NAD(P)H-dependent oxidoreductase subunit E [Clostridia bacterium]